METQPSSFFVASGLSLFWIVPRFMPKNMICTGKSAA